MKTKVKKMLKAFKELQKFYKQTKKNYLAMKARITKIMAVLLMAVVLASCGSTRVSVDKPQQGTQTTITVTTNNPITTEITPNVELNKNK